MIVEYKISKYKCFNSEVTLSFNPSAKCKNNLEKYYILKDVLKIGIIYGANESGKTTLLESLSTLKRIISHKLNINLENTIFKLSFICDSKLYTYNLQFENYIIKEESLVECDNIVFKRFMNEITTDKSISSLYPNEPAISKILEFIPSLHNYFNDKFIPLEQNSILDNNINMTNVSNYMELANFSNIENKHNRSDGFNKFFNLSCVLELSKKHGYLFGIDNIELYLHPKLVKKFIIDFLNHSKSQIIITTHLSELLLEDSILRNDCIHFLNRHIDDIELYSATDFEEGVVNNLYYDYTSGKLGGKPKTV